LGYVSLAGLTAATEQPVSRLCRACFDGDYPIELPGETALGKNVIEHMLENAARSGLPLEPVKTVGDAADAVRRP
jgi:amidophosphoribosyltransferase